MFQSARVTLTIWYVLIISVICLFLTFPIYFSISQELSHIENTKTTHIPSTIMPPRFPFAGESVPAARMRIITTMIAINGTVILIGSVLGYFLAGKTLKPIKQMVDEQNRFITDAAHELRTPLTALRSEVEFILMKYNLERAVITRLESSLEEVDNMKTLTDDLLLLSRTQYPQVNITTVSLLDVLESAIKKVVPLARDKHITIDNQITDVLLYVNHQAISQVFTILLDNAIKYSEPGKRIVIASRNTREHTIIDVTDEGFGIEPENLIHIFDRFYRSDESRSKINVQGYGLGLSIAKKIAENYHGSIHVQSTVGKGSVFSVSFPIKKI